MAVRVVSVTIEGGSPSSSLTHSSSYISCVDPAEMIQAPSPSPPPSPASHISGSRRSSQSESQGRHHVQQPQGPVSQYPAQRQGRGRAATGGPSGRNERTPLVPARQNARPQPAHQNPRPQYTCHKVVVVVIVLLTIITLSVFTVLWYVKIAPVTWTEHHYISNHEVLKIDAQWFMSRALKARLFSVPTDPGKVVSARGSCTHMDITSTQQHEYYSNCYTVKQKYMPFGTIRFIVHLLNDGYVRISFSLNIKPSNGYTLYYGALASYTDMLRWEEQCNQHLTSPECTENSVPIFQGETHSVYGYIYHNSSSLGKEHVYITARLDSSFEAQWPVQVAVHLVAVTQDYQMPKNVSNCTDVSGGGGEIEGEGGGDGVGGSGGSGSGEGDGGGDGSGEGDGESEVLCSVSGHDVIFDALTDSKRCVYIKIYGEDFLLHNTSVQYDGRIDFPLYFLVLPVMIVLGGSSVYCCVRVSRR